MCVCVCVNAEGSWEALLSTTTTRTTTGSDRSLHSLSGLKIESDHCLHQQTECKDLDLYPLVYRWSCTMNEFVFVPDCSLLIAQICILVSMSTFSDGYNYFAFLLLFPCAFLPGVFWLQDQIIIHLFASVKHCYVCVCVRVCWPSTQTGMQNKQPDYSTSSSMEQRWGLEIYLFSLWSGTMDEFLLTPNCRWYLCDGINVNFLKSWCFCVFPVVSVCISSRLSVLEWTLSIFVLFWHVTVFTIFRWSSLSLFCHLHIDSLICFRWWYNLTTDICHFPCTLLFWLCLTPMFSQMVSSHKRIAG